MGSKLGGWVIFLTCLWRQIEAVANRCVAGMPCLACLARTGRYKQGVAFVVGVTDGAQAASAPLRHAYQGCVADEGMI